MRMSMLSTTWPYGLKAKCPILMQIGRKPLARFQGFSSAARSLMELVGPKPEGEVNCLPLLG